MKTRWAGRAGAVPAGGTAPLCRNPTRTPTPGIRVKAHSAPMGVSHGGRVGRRPTRSSSQCSSHLGSPAKIGTRMGSMWAAPPLLSPSMAASAIALGLGALDEGDRPGPVRRTRGRPRAPRSSTSRWSRRGRCWCARTPPASGGGDWLLVTRPAVPVARLGYGLRTPRHRGRGPRGRRARGGGRREGDAVPPGPGGLRLGPRRVRRVRAPSPEAALVPEAGPPDPRAGRGRAASLASPPCRRSRDAGQRPAGAARS